MTQTTVLEFLEENPRTLPQIKTVERTTHSKYIFYLLVRHYRNRLGIRPTFFAYTKADGLAVRGILEEHSIFNPNPLYVLEDFPRDFVYSLHLPSTAHVVAEVEKGELGLPQMSYRRPRDILKVLLMSTQLDLDARYSLRALLEQDWSSIPSFEGYEPVLNRAKILGLTEDQIGDELKGAQWEKVLLKIKAGDLSSVFAMERRLSSEWLWSAIARLIIQTVQYKSLQRMKYDHNKIRDELDLGYRVEELAETSERYKLEELGQMVRYYIKMDSLYMRRPDLAVALFLLKNPTRLVK